MATDPLQRSDAAVDGVDHVDADAGDWVDDAIRTRAGVVIPVRATSRRPGWTDLPDAVREHIETLAGAAVVDAWSAGTGFTPGFASRLTLASGERIFVKVAGDPDDRLHGWPLSDAYREEARKHRAFRPGIGAPGLLWSDDTVLAGDRWVVLGLQYVDGRPPRRPWRPAELELVLDTLTAVAPALAEPPAELALPTVEDDLVGDYEHRLRQVSDLEAPDGWLDTVAALCAESHLIAGESMVHLDLRDDNVLVTDAGQVWFVDWNFPAIGAPWIDLVCILLSARGDGLDVEAVIASHPLTRDADPHAIDVLLAVLWSFWGSARTDPVPTRSPHLRDHQTWYAHVTQDWLLERLGFPSIPAPPDRPPAPSA